MCLYCEKLYKTPQGCQQHMIDSCHCKLKYDEEQDLEEFEGFYNFSSSWDDYEGSDEEGNGGEDGNAEGEWETASDEEGEGGDEVEAEESKAGDAAAVKAKKRYRLEYSYHMASFKAASFVQLIHTCFSSDCAFLAIGEKRRCPKSRCSTLASCSLRTATVSG